MESGQEMADIESALQQANPMALGLALVYVTGDLDLLKQLESAEVGRSDKWADLPAQVASSLHQRAVETLSSLGTERLSGPKVGMDVLRRMIRMATGSDLSDDYCSMLMEQAALRVSSAAVEARAAHPSDKLADFRVVVIGAGMSGICAAIELKREGIPFTVFEKNETVGGTWHENAYPGCGVDTPSFFYSYSFEQNPNWSYYFSKREEIQEYFEFCARKYGIDECIQFKSEVSDAVFREAQQIWEVTVRTPAGRKVVRANAVITAVGQLNKPAIPQLPGLDTFAGPAMHTAEWDPSVDVAGKRVAIIGTGASAMQVGPTIAPHVGKLTIYQRSPHWILANPYYHKEILAPQKWLQGNLPSYLQWLRIQMIWSYGDAVYPAVQVDPDWKTPDVSLNAVSERYRQNMLRHLEQELSDRPDLIAKTAPGYPPYGKRVLLDNHWFRMLKRDNVELVTSDIEYIKPHAIVTKDGVEHPADQIVFATGFQASRMLWPVNFQGRDGISLQQLWGEDNPRAYLGISIPRFPNLFLLYGPNTNLAFGGSAIFHSECQVRYAVCCIRALIDNNWRSIECKRGVHDAYNAKVDQMHERMVWARKDVSNWYRNRHGRVTTNSPWRLFDYWRMTREPNFDDYTVQKKPVEEPAAVMDKT